MCLPFILPHIIGRADTRVRPLRRRFANISYAELIFLYDKMSQCHGARKYTGCQQVRP